MVDLQVITNTGANTVLTEALVEEFQTSLRGPLLQPGDAGYDDARIVWNGMIDRRPALIARCAGVADVIQAVNFARDNHLLVSVRGGGHNITGYAVNDGGIVIDLSQMKSLHVDLAKSTARAEAGLTWGTRLKPLAWPAPAALFLPRASPDFPLAVAWGGLWASTA